MSAATDLFAPEYQPLPALPRRHLTAVPGDTGWSEPITTAGNRTVPVSVLHAPEAEAVALRLTRRGVVVLALLVAVFGAVLVWLGAASGPDAPAAGIAAPVGATVTVQAGDTLWTIAGRVAPAADPRAEVEHLRELNHLDDAALQPGQELRTR